MTELETIALDEWEVTFVMAAGEQRREWTVQVPASDEKHALDAAYGIAWAINEGAEHVWKITDERRAKRVEGLTRLAMAERVCALLGAMPAPCSDDREKALYELWREWMDRYGHAVERIDDDEVAALARRRDETRERTLARLRSGAGSPE